MLGGLRTRLRGRLAAKALIRGRDRVFGTHMLVAGLAERPWLTLQKPDYVGAPAIRPGRGAATGFRSINGLGERLLQVDRTRLARGCCGRGCQAFEC